MHVYFNTKERLVLRQNESERLLNTRSLESKHLKSSRQGFVKRHTTAMCKTPSHSRYLLSLESCDNYIPTFKWASVSGPPPRGPPFPREPKNLYYLVPLSCSTQGPSVPPRSGLFFIFCPTLDTITTSISPETVRFFKGNLSYLTYTELKESWKDPKIRIFNSTFSINLTDLPFKSYVYFL